MRRLFLFAALLSLAACSGSSTKKLALFHTNDEHSHLLGDGPESDDFPAPTTAGSGAIKGGAARRATLLKSERAKAQGNGYDVLTVSAGDNAMGTLAQVAFATDGADYRLMKLLGYDVTTLGNHEFDYGPKPLAGAISKAKASTEGLPVIVASNIHFSGTSGDSDLAALFDEGHADAAKPLHRSWVITTPNGLKVGFVGLMGVNAAQLAPLKAPTKFSVSSCCTETDTPSALIQLYADAQAQVNKLRYTEKVDVVVALSHAGLDSKNPALGEDTLIAQNVSDLDVIVSGHSHTYYPAKLVTNLKTQKPVLVQQTGSFGDHLGRIQLSVTDGVVSFETAAGESGLLPIDDTIIPDPAIATFVSGVLDGLEKTKLAGVGKSFLEYEVGLTTGAAVTDDPAVVGDLAFKAIAKSSYTVDNSSWQKETALLRISADAALRTTEAIAGPTDVGVQGAGVLRAELRPNKKGELSFADIFRVVPLGASPATGTPGYPMTRFALYLAELKVAFEVTAGLAYSSETNGDFYLIPSGFCFEFDTTRPAYDNAGSAFDPTNGRVTKISKASDHTKLDTCDVPVYDVAHGGYLVSPLTLYTATTNLYVTTFAYVAGVTLKDPAAPHGPITPTQAILHWDAAKLAEVKEWEALGGYLKSLNALPPGGDLPVAYTKDHALTRAKCSGPLCR